jgi:RND family efflux transporter MFP subunit
MHAKQVLGFVVVLAASACADKREKLTQLPAADGKGAAPVALQVEAATVTREPIVRSVVANGTTEAARVADLGPQLTGRIGALLVREGDKVKAGQNLVRLDADEAALRVQQTAASAAQAKAQFELAKAEYERLAPLLQHGTVTPQQLQRLAGQRDALKSATEAAHVAQSDAARMQTNTIVRAPFAGVISKVNMEVGEVATMMPPSVLLRLVDLSNVDVRVRVHERELSRIAIGDAVEANFSSSKQKAEGKVSFISPEIDPRTRNAEVVTRIPNPSGTLRAGMFAEISIKPKLVEDSLVIPASAVAGTGDGRYVYAIENGVAKRIKVRVAPIDAQRVELLEGVPAETRIVASGLGKLSDGATLEVKP